MKYIVQVGREPALAVSEILTLADTYNVSVSLSWIHDSLVCFEAEQECDFISTDRLGGAMKVIEPVEYIEGDVVQTIADHVLKAEGKITFGVSSWISGDEYAPQHVCPAVKQLVREQERTARFILPKRKQLDAAVIIHSDILTSGGEFHIIPEGDRVLLGRTLSVHNIDDWGRRDFKKPARDAKRGMLPPKLARTMVNLAGVSEGRMLDPFCGTGTVSMEASLLGYTAIASDADPAAIEATQKNADWMVEQYQTQPIEVLQSDARDVARRVKEPVVAIVTEPYLGNPNKLTHAQREEHAVGIADLYADALKNWTKILETGARVVMVIPLYKTREGLVQIPIHTRFKKLGYRIIPPMSPLSLDDERSPAGNLLYGRDDQRVLREIILLLKL